MKLSRFRYSDGYEPDDYYEYNEHFSSSRNSYKEKTDALRTLISHIQKIDSLKDEILNRNVSLSKLAFLTKLLNDPITLNGFRDRDKSFMLSKPIDIEESFFNAGLLNMVLDVRRGQFLFPKYCLCEGKKSYFRNYGVITSEYYQSFDYTVPDPRFIRLMHNGHEMPFVRMAPFREKTAALFNNNPEDAENHTEALLQKVGNYFLQNAWHEDQEILFSVGNHLGGLPKFIEATELLFFILGSDFSIIRRQMSPDIKSFFEKVYSRDALVKLLNRIENGTEAEMQEVEKRGRIFYQQLNIMFSEFLQTPVNWGPDGVIKGIPLFKIVFSNLSRLHLLSELQNDPKIKGAMNKLEEFGEETMFQINEKVTFNHAEFKIFNPN